MMYANPTDLQAAIRSWDTLRREVGSDEEEEGDVKGEKSMMGMIGLILLFSFCFFSDLRWSKYRGMGFG